MFSKKREAPSPRKTKLHLPLSYAQNINDLPVFSGRSGLSPVDEGPSSKLACFTAPAFGAFFGGLSVIDLDSDKSGVVGSSLKVLTLYLNTGISVTLKTNGAIHYLSLSQFINVSSDFGRNASQQYLS